MFLTRSLVKHTVWLSVVLICFSNKAFANCELKNLYQKYLHFDKSHESQEDYWKRVNSFIFIDKEKLTEQYEKLSSSDNNSSFLSQFADLNDFILYNRYQKFELLTTYQTPSHFSQICKKEKGHLKLLMDVHFVSEHWKGVNIYFIKIKGEWMFDYTWPVVNNEFDNWKQDSIFKIYN